LISRTDNAFAGAGAFGLSVVKPEPCTVSAQSMRMLRARCALARSMWMLMPLASLRIDAASASARWNCAW
jgi:hypothetical protein